MSPMVHFHLLLANVVHNDCCAWHDDANKVKRMDR